jgi:hypothetical protein
MYPIDFHKERAEYLLNCIKKGRAIEPMGQTGWTATDLLVLAGVCFFAVESQGPLGYAVKHSGDLSKIEEALNNLHSEHREAAEGQFMADLQAAIAFSAHLAMLIKHNHFDQYFEPHVQALATQSTATNCQLVPVAGHKKRTDRNR